MNASTLIIFGIVIFILFQKGFWKFVGFLLKIVIFIILLGILFSVIKHDKLDIPSAVHNATRAAKHYIVQML
jgi:hypothetical protein